MLRKLKKVLIKMNCKIKINKPQFCTVVSIIVMGENKNARVKR